LTPTSIEREIMMGGNLSQNSVSVSNSGGAPLNFAATPGASWFVVNTASGRVEPGSSQNLSLSYAVSGLAPGVYNSTLSVADPMAANSPRTVSVKVTILAPPFAPVDFDQDGDVDQEDFGRFQACYSGPGIPQLDPNCAGARLDDDDDVDQADFEIFLTRCLSGPGVPADTACNR